MLPKVAKVLEDLHSALSAIRKTRQRLSIPPLFPSSPYHPVRCPVVVIKNAQVVKKRKKLKKRKTTVEMGWV